jgi:hypothetical protein
MEPGTLLPFADLTLDGPLPSGVYQFPGGAAFLSGSLTLDGQGNANAFWVFEIASTLITSPGSVVNVINTGPGAGLFWNVGSSATIDTTTSFEGNILALASIMLNTDATIGCGRALANTAAVTMDTNTISIGCTTELGGAPPFWLAATAWAVALRLHQGPMALAPRRLFRSPPSRNPPHFCFSVSGWRVCLSLEKSSLLSLDGLRGNPVQLPCATFRHAGAACPETGIVRRPDADRSPARCHCRDHRTQRPHPDPRRTVARDALAQAFQPA